MNTKRIIINNIETDYTIDTCGNVYSIKRNKYIKPIPDKDGYLRVNIYVDKKMYTKRVHRLVAMAFIENPLNLPVVNHKDCNILNNNASNLEWVTIQYNTEHAKINGLIRGAISPNPKKGELHHNALIKEIDAINIINLLLDGYSVNKISSRLAINNSIVYDILYKRSWKHLTDNVIFPERKYKYSKELKSNIIELVKRGYTNECIFKTLELEKNNTTRDIIKRIRKKLINDGWVIFKIIDI